MISDERRTEGCRGVGTRLTLEEIAQMSAPDGSPGIVRAMLVTKADQLGQMIVMLRVMSKGLLHAAVSRHCARPFSNCSRQSPRAEEEGKPQRVA